MLPQTNKASADQNPSVVAMAQALKDLDQVKTEKEAVMAQGVTNLENLNAVEDLMAAQKGLTSKQEAMTKHINIFKAHFNANEKCEERRKEICQVVQTNGPTVQQLAGSGMADPATNQFFMQVS